MSISCLRIIFQLHLFRVTVDFQFIHILPAEIIQIAFRNSFFFFVQHPRIHRNPQNRRRRPEVILCSVELEVNPSLAPHYYSQDSAKASITSFFVVKNPWLKSRASDSPSGFSSLATRLHLPFYLLSCFICPMHCLPAVSYSDSLSAPLR